MIYAGVEGGGTTWVCVLCKDRVDNIIDKKEFCTRRPEETLVKIRKWLDARCFDALGIATFGPIDIKKGSDTWGFILKTPKAYWSFTDVVGALWNKKCPVKFDTDVNAPALSEYLYSNKGENYAYISVGTGVGVGLVINGKPVHGLLHPEGGHLLIRKRWNDSFSGICPYHDDCIEGLVSSRAIAKRLGISYKDLPNLLDDHPVWDFVAHAIACLCIDLILIVSPNRIILSGGVMKREILFSKIHLETQKMLNNYIDHSVLTTDEIKSYIIPSKWKNNAGCIGALTLAEIAFNEKII